jgi:hypothetical protein
MEVSVRRPTGETHVLSGLSPQTTLQALQEQLATVAGVPVPLQRLIWQGAVLEMDEGAERTLQTLGVEAGHVLHLVVRREPGTFPTSREGLPWAPRRAKRLLPALLSDAPPHSC